MCVSSVCACVYGHAYVYDNNACAKYERQRMFIPVRVRLAIKHNLEFNAVSSVKSAAVVQRFVVHETRPRIARARDVLIV